MNTEKMQAVVPRVSNLMKVLSHESRILILCQLVEGERSVGELARLLDIREQAMSQQLARLRAEGLVATRREGQTIHYRLDREDVRALVVFLYATYCSDESFGR